MLLTIPTICHTFSRAIFFHNRPCFLVILFFFSVCSTAEAVVVEYDLTIAETQVNYTGKPVEAMTINGAIPGPVLRFTEGDIARIHVRNNMEVDTSIHWHGILVPPDMDGVPYLSFPPIAPGTTFTYEFPIRQSGTYWYHSHTGLQEQRGLYGAIVIKPRSGHVEKHPDHVILFSDWSDEKPSKINRTLKRGSEWYSLAKGSGQSILGAAKAGMLSDYFQREFTRMPPMDISDVAYDRFLANGKTESQLTGIAGKTVRLRLINGSATTYFHVEFAGGPMTIIATDGIDVQPTRQKRLLIAVAETYDVLVTIPATGAYELRGTAHDGSNHATVWLGEVMKHPADNIPKPNLYSLMHHTNLSHAFALTPAGAMGMPDNKVNSGMFDAPGMAPMGHDMQTHTMETEHTDSHHMQHNHHASKDIDQSGHQHMQSHPQEKDTKQRQMEQTARNMSGKQYSFDFGFLSADISSASKLSSDGMGDERPWPPYKKLKAVHPTDFGPNKTVREFRFTLDGDMERYIWSLNNKTLSESDSILIHEGEVARFILINRTMMHHPMHLHGHFFRVINGQGDYAPLKHTVDVAPMSTTVIEFDANETGDWFFHCHLLYHMKAGMSRVVHYDNFMINPELAAIRPQLARNSWYAWGKTDILSNMTEGALTLSNTRNIVNAYWEVGWENVPDTEWEGIFSWDRYINRFSTVFAGLNMHGQGSSEEETRGFAGFQYLLPLNIHSRSWIDTDGGFRIALDKHLEMTPRLSLTGEVRYDTHDLWEGKVGLTYLIHENFSLAAAWHSDFYWGAGLQLRF